MNEVKIARLVLGPVSTNCYLLKNEASGEIVIIDPADQPEEILESARELEGVIRGVLLTHGHYDHIGAVQTLRDETGARVVAHNRESGVLSDPMRNLSGIAGRTEVSVKADCLVEDDETVEMGGLSFRVLYTPGHTEGGCCYYLASEGMLFSGDTLFDHSVGRTDLPTGNMEVLLGSIRKKLFSLPEETWVLPGHGPATRIGDEKRENPFVRGAAL